jgi:hypothetical protein
MHGGKISVYSAGEGMGCSFTVEIEMHRKKKASSTPTYSSSLLVFFWLYTCRYMHVCMLGINMSIKV